MPDHPELYETGGFVEPRPRPKPSPNYRSHTDAFMDQMLKRIATEPEVTLKDLKESIDELIRYFKPYSGNLLVGKSAVDEYEKLLKGDRYDTRKK